MMIQKGERVPFYRDLSEAVDMDVKMSDIVVEKAVEEVKEECCGEEEGGGSHGLVRGTNIVSEPPVPKLDVKLETLEMEDKGRELLPKLEINKAEFTDKDTDIFNHISVKTNILENSCESKDNIVVKTVSEDSSDWGLSDQDIDRLLDPYVHRINKRISCGICGMKFFNKTKAKSHVENKHVDCFQYKCPFCKSIKSKRLSYQCHIVAKHSAKKGQFIPKIRMRKKFCVTGAETAPSAGESSPEVASERNNSNYDLGFVTFLRTILAASAAAPTSWHRVLTCAEWIDIEQGIFRINSPDEFTTRWHQFKETAYISWATLQATVINSFINRNILKILDHEELVFQVFCIRKLLK